MCYAEGRGSIPRGADDLKCTDLGSISVLPVEEVAWLFHHVVKAALWQLKVFELPWTGCDPQSVGPLPGPVRAAG